MLKIKTTNKQQIDTLRKYLKHKFPRKKVIIRDSDKSGFIGDRSREIRVRGISHRILLKELNAFKKTLNISSVSSRSYNEKLNNLQGADRTLKANAILFFRENVEYLEKLLAENSNNLRLIGPIFDDRYHDQLVIKKILFF